VRLFSQGFPPDDVFAHLRHKAAQKALPDLIVQLRAAADVKDSYEFRQELIGHVRETGEARNAFSRAVKRMEDGKWPQPDAPEPQSGRKVRRCVCKTPLMCVTATGSALSTVSSPPTAGCSMVNTGPPKPARRPSRTVTSTETTH
jgi:hypothetical protein